MNNKHGFVLMETLVVTIFSLSIFSLLYTNIVPLLGRYKELSYYDDIDTTYDLYHVKNLLTSDGKYGEILDKDYSLIKCVNEPNIDSTAHHIEVLSNQNACYSLFEALNIDSSNDEIVVLNANNKNEFVSNSYFTFDIRSYVKQISFTGFIILLQNDGYVSYIKL